MNGIKKWLISCDWLIKCCPYDVNPRSPLFSTQLQISNAQGLSRYSDSTGVEAIYPIELMAEQQLGKNWQKDFIKSVQIEKVLL
jgi:hypothetical protein